MEALRPLLIAGLVITEVTIWQWRMVIAHRGQRTTALLLGVVGAALQITAIAQVIAGVHDPLSVAAYAGGVGCGVLLGIVAGERLTPGAVAVTIFVAVERRLESELRQDVHRVDAAAQWIVKELRSSSVLRTAPRRPNAVSPPHPGGHDTPLQELDAA
jgi:uncharacterized protein YebE (UPF0316 family)